MSNNDETPLGAGLILGCLVFLLVTFGLAVLVFVLRAAWTLGGSL